MDVLFASVALATAAATVGVILTGMGRDGAQGMLKMHQAGSFNIAQDEQSCVVFGMPREAIAAGAVDRVLPLNRSRPRSCARFTGKLARWSELSRCPLQFLSLAADSMGGALLDRSLTQDEINGLFRSARGRDEEAADRAVPYDFRRPDRIAKEQLRAVHLLHDGFARTLASSLSAYLRAYVVVNLVSVEQLSFAEFSQCLPSPTCLVSLGLKPYEGNAVLEISSSVVFPILEMLLGGSGKTSANMRREVTEIEQVVLDGLYRIILHDLRQAWAGITPIDFTIEARETEPQLLQVMAPNEAVVAIGLEVRMPDNSGMINIGMPSIIIKMLRQKFEQQWSVRRAESTQEEQARVLPSPAARRACCSTRACKVPRSASRTWCASSRRRPHFRSSVEHSIDLLVNGALKFNGHMMGAGQRRRFVIEEMFNRE